MNEETEIDFEGIKDYLKEEFGIELPDGRFVVSGKKVYLYTGKEFGVPGRYGMYIGSNDQVVFRPSSYIAQFAKKGFTEVEEKDAMQWMCGLDIKVEAEGYFTIVLFGKYIIGVGKPKEGRIINNLPKNRRLPLRAMH